MKICESETCVHCSPCSEVRQTSHDSKSKSSGMIEQALFSSSSVATCRQSLHAISLFLLGIDLCSRGHVSIIVDGVSSDQDLARMLGNVRFDQRQRRLQGWHWPGPEMGIFLSSTWEIRGFLGCPKCRAAHSLSLSQLKGALGKP